MTVAGVLTIDGPSGSGKGTVARLVSRRLGWRLLDSGALYRLVALAAQRAGVEFSDEETLARLARGLAVDFEPTDGGGQKVLMSGEDVGLAIRTERCGDAASRVAVLPAVRAALVDLQRACRQPPGLVADGRDMGSVIFPDADLKIFLTASAEERAKRRYKQLKEQGIDVSLSGLSSEITERDRRDASREVSPLAPASGAILIDSTGMSITAVVDEVTDLARRTYGVT